MANLMSAKAARNALKRKKQHEHTLEQTTAQISTLEQQIYSIEAANINRETLAAMERAGEAMQQIHGKLNIDKVDETMYVRCEFYARQRGDTDMGRIGRSYENSMRLAKKSPALLQVLLLGSLSTKASWTTSLPSWSRSSSMIRC